jgi:hypothetical protein
MYRIYFQEGTSDLVLDGAIRSLKSHAELRGFLVGDQRLFADPAALRIEATSVTALAQFNPLMDHTVVVSPRAALMLVGSSTQEEWTSKLTEVRNRNPECAITKVSWRTGHHDGNVWALPEALPSQIRADRVEEGRRRRPRGAFAYFAEILTVTVTGPQGPNPNQLLLVVLSQVQVALGRALQPAQPDDTLLPDQYREDRNGDGDWTGVLSMRLVCPVEIRQLHAMLQGALVEVGSTHAVVTAFNPRVDSSSGAPGGRGGGR